MQLEVRLEAIGDLQKKLSITIAADEVDERFSSAYRKLRKEAEKLGVKKGKVKKKKLERRFGKKVATEINADLVAEALEKALNEHELRPVGKPELALGALEPGEPFSFTATIWVRPEPAVTEYVDVPVSRSTPTLTNAEIDGHIESMRMQSGVVESVDEDRPVADGDVVDVTVTFQDESYGDLIREHQLIRVPDDPHHGFLIDLVRGLERGGTATDTVTIPESYLQEDWAGRTCKAAVLLHGIQTVTPPPLDADFAKRMGHESVDDLREALRDELLDMMLERNREREARQLIETLIERNPFELPPPLVADRARGLIASVAAHLTGSMSNAAPPTLDDLEDDKRQDVLNEAEYSLRRELLLAAVAKQEQLDLNEADREAGLDRLAAQTGRPVDVLLDLIPEASMAQIEQRFLEDKTLAWLLERTVRAEDE